jgi:hypothetical protein
MATVDNANGGDIKVGTFFQKIVLRDVNCYFCPLLASRETL